MKMSETVSSGSNSTPKQPDTSEKQLLTETTSREISRPSSRISVVTKIGENENMPKSSSHLAKFENGACEDINSEVSLYYYRKNRKSDCSKKSEPASTKYLNYFEDDQSFERKVHEVETAISDGVSPQLITSGSSGSYFVKNTAGKITAVFKPRDEEPYGPANPKWGKFIQRHICPCCFGRSCLILNHGYLSEAGASVVDELLGLNIVPPTKVIILTSDAFNYLRSRKRYCCYSKLPKVSLLFKSKYPPKIGSFQLFVEDYQNATSALQIFSKKPLSPEAEKEFCIEFQKMTVLDYIIRNTDRGGDNWLLKVDRTTKDTVVSLAAIDNGLAFPIKHPDEWRKYPFYWAVIPRAKTPYAKEVRELVLPVIEQESFIKDLVMNLYKLFRIDKNFKLSQFEKQISVMRGQLENLIVALNEGYSPFELVNMQPITVDTRVKKGGELVLGSEIHTQRSKNALCKSC